MLPVDNSTKTHNSTAQMGQGEMVHENIKVSLCRSKNNGRCYFEKEIEMHLMDIAHIL